MSSTSDELAYARVRYPPVPVLDVSGIEKSSFRLMMDKRSDGIRKGLSKTFGAKKKNSDVEEIVRPHTPASAHSAHAEEVRGSEEKYQSTAPVEKSRDSSQQQQQLPQRQPQEDSDNLNEPRPGPPQTQLPPVPQVPLLKRWAGYGRPLQPWNKLRKDPELWDPNGDTLIFLGHESPRSARPPPSFRLSSHVLEATESRFLITMLREGAIDENGGFGMPPSPIGSPGTKSPPYVRSASRQQAGPTPPVSEHGAAVYDGQISYEIHFPAPAGLTKPETLRYHVTTRNVFALIFHASLVGHDLYQSLSDLHLRLDIYMPPETDTAQLIIDYLAVRALDDVRSNPTTTATLLAWSEGHGVRWEEGWREAYVHASGMYNMLEDTPEFRHVTPITKALLERSSLEIQVRVNAAEDRLASFDFSDMWPSVKGNPAPAQSSFERLRKFFIHHYQSAYEAWPPQVQAGEDIWLTRGVAEHLQQDFGALYDYIVNRDVLWDCYEERSGRKWVILHPGDKTFAADSDDLPFTDILVAFDNRHKYPHIPHPYPLVPDLTSISAKSSTDSLGNPSRRNRPGDEKMAERRAALAYTESTNIYLLGSDFAANELVDAFVRFEKADKVGDSDLAEARKGRWILIYGILQVLATVAVDTPNVRYTAEVPYHINAKLRGTPPWKGALQRNKEADHESSYCWKIPATWNDSRPQEVPSTVISDHSFPLPHAYRAPKVVSQRSSSIAADSENGSYVLQSRGSVASQSRRGTVASVRSTGKEASPRIPDVSGFSGFNFSQTGYGPGIEKVDVDERELDWPISEGSRGSSKNPPSTREDSRARSSDQDGSSLSKRDIGRGRKAGRDRSKDDREGVGVGAVNLVIKDFDEFEF